MPKSSFESLDFHTTEFNEQQLTDVVEAILDRVRRNYSEQKIDIERLRKGILRCHADKPIRLIALLNTCGLDFPTDVIFGIYRNYNPTTDTMRNGWTAQHAEPHRDFWASVFASEYDDDENEEDY